MGVVVADRAVDLAEQFDRASCAALAPQAVDHVGEFLAERGRRGRLAVGARQHRQLGVLVRQRAQRRSISVVPLRQQHLARASRSISA
jgi:hypothetical protein